MGEQWVWSGMAELVGPVCLMRGLKKVMHHVL